MKCALACRLNAVVAAIVVMGMGSREQGDTIKWSGGRTRKAFHERCLHWVPTEAGKGGHV